MGNQTSYNLSPLNIMGQLSLFLLVSFPLLTIGSEPFSFFDSYAELKAGNKREERSQSGLYTAPNSYQPSISVYQPVDTIDLTNITVPATIIPTFEDVFGFTLAEKTKEDTDALIGYLTQLDQNQEASKLINSEIEANPCIDSLKDMIDLVQGGARIVENAGPDIEQMFATINSLRDERDITILVRGSADILVQLNSLFPKLETFSFYTRCRVSSPHEGLQTLRDQAQLLYRMSLVSDFKFTQQIKDNLLRSALITESVTNFLDHLQRNLAERNCFTGNDFLGDGTLLGAQVMDDLAEVLGVLGYLPSAKETRQYAVFTRSMAESIRKMDDFKIADDCSPGALVRAANYLNDLASLIDEVGLLELGVNLGLVFRLDLLP